MNKQQLMAETKREQSGTPGSAKELASTRGRRDRSDAMVGHKEIDSELSKAGGSVGFVTISCVLT